MNPDIDHPFVLVIHGGAGTIKKEFMTIEKETAYHEKLKESLQSGYNVLKAGGTAMDAVTAAIIVMEDSPLFNCGKGSVYTNDEIIEMDASIMNGETGAAGAVCGVRTVKNPITAARAVMEHSEHVMLSGVGADHFAQKEGCTIVDPSYFHDENRLNQLKSVKAKEQSLLHRDAQTSNEVVKIGGSAIEFNVTLPEDKKIRHSWRCRVGQTWPPCCRDKYRRNVEQALW
jgi:beta-aspartyl-peptidase (threonine type)